MSNYLKSLAQDASDHRIDQIFNAFVRKLNAEDEPDADVMFSIYNKLPTLYRENIKLNIRVAEVKWRLTAAMILAPVYGAGSTSLRSLRLFFSDMTDGEDAAIVDEYLRDELNLITCDDCGEIEFSDRTREPYGSSDEVCRDCIESSYRWSSYYEQYVHEDSYRMAVDADGDEVLIHEDDDDFSYNDDIDQYAHYDYEYEPPEPQIIGDYHSSKRRVQVRPSSWTKMKNRYMGVELEVEVVHDEYNREDKAAHLNTVINGDEIGKNVFFERDGSLSNGFEIITHPMGMDDHKKMWEWLKDRKAVRGMRSHQTSTCGLHVHVSKSTLSKLQIAKIVTFVNNRDNQPLIKAVARRYETGYCKIKNKKIGQSHYSEDRYEAVNITPRTTIEFRIFRGSLKYESVMAAIQFSNAVVEFCDPSRTSVRDLTADNFLRFIREDIPEDTDILVPYIEQRLELA